MNSCEKAATLTSIALDRKLTLGESVGWIIHRALCGPCRMYLKQMQTLRRGTRALAEPAAEEPPLETAARERIREQLRAAQEKPAPD
jgi:predicted anti-sigma-YlaC factor YlaD